MKPHVFRRPSSIAGRLLIFSGVFVTLAMIVASAILWIALNAVIREQIDQRLDTQINALAAAVTHDDDGKLTLSVPLDVPPFDRPGSGWYWQIEHNGQRLTSHSLDDKNIDVPPPRQDFLQMLRGVPVPGEGRDNGRELYLRQTSRNVDGQLLLITATAPTDALTDPALRALFWLMPSMLVLGVVLLAGTLWQTRFGLRPLKSMAADIDAINRGERVRLPQQATSELGPLASKTNALLHANEEQLAATRIQFANLAHGLKTPVASLLLALSDANDPDGALRALVLRIDNRIKHHLSAARRVMASSETTSKTDVVRVVADVHGALSHIHAERGIIFHSDISGDLWVACEESDFEEMLGNLMDNAFKWATRRVVVEAVRDGAFVRIALADDGTGIPRQRLDAVLLPGVREDQRVPGDGFGLAIVTELAGLYGGSLVLEANTPNGLNAILRLPAVAISPSQKANPSELS